MMANDEDDIPDFTESPGLQMQRANLAVCNTTTFARKSNGTSGSR